MDADKELINALINEMFEIGFVFQFSTVGLNLDLLETAKRSSPSSKFIKILKCRYLSTREDQILKSAFIPYIKEHTLLKLSKLIAGSCLLSPDSMQIVH